jgi:hypothetical protein
VAIILCANYFTKGTLQTILVIAGIAAAIVLPVVIYILYRWLKKDNSAASDELEQLVLLKAAAITGILALTMLPVLLLLVCLLPQAAGYCVFAYAILVAGGFKLSMYYYYKKY